MEKQAIFKVATKGYRYSLVVWDDKDGTYSVECFTRGNSSMRSSGHKNKHNAISWAQKHIAMAKTYDNINYQEVAI